MLSGNFTEMTTSTPFRDLLHAANLRHGTDGFTSLPKEGVLRIFFPALKNPTASAGFEPANLPCVCVYIYIYIINTHTHRVQLVYIVMKGTVHFVSS